MALFKTKNLLSVSADAKTIKGEKMGYLTGILYLAPNDLSGFQVCAKATDGCKKACLYTSGQGRFSNVQQARINKTRWFFLHRVSFMAQMVKNIKSLIRKALKGNMIPVVRLNGTSDIPFEKIKCVRNGVTYNSPMEAFSDIQFYDYTKILGRKKVDTLPNYHLTFSMAESNDDDCLTALANGLNVAVVMAVGKNTPKPKTWKGYPVVDGDKNDLRFLDSTNGGHIVSLYAKADAKKDTSGFVRKANCE